MNRTQVIFGLALVTILAIFTTPGEGAQISFALPKSISGEGDIDTTGTLVAAYNIGEHPSAVAINGVSFAPFPVADSSLEGAQGNFALSGSSFSTAADLGSSSSPFSTLSSAYRIMLSSAVVDTFFTSFELTLGGLTPGAKYELQLWANDSGPVFDGDPYPIYSGGATVIDSNVGNVPGGLGQTTIGTFVADTLPQTLFFGDPVAVLPVLNGFQLRQIDEAPEPSMTAVVLAGFALAVVRTRATPRDAER